MVTAVNNLIDDVMDDVTIASWLNMGKDKMAQLADAAFPDINPSNPNSTWVFDAKWHQCPILYAAAKYKEEDTAIQEVGNFMGQFREMAAQFAEKYVVPPVYRDDPYSQQFGYGVTAVKALFPNASTGYFAIGTDYTNDPNYSSTTPAQTYQITKDTFVPYRAQLSVYVNNQKVPVNLYTDNGDGSFTINPAYTVQTQDQITAIWNQVEDQIQPPYAWWN